MVWVLGGAFLLGMGVFFRWLLGLSFKSPARHRALDSWREHFCQELVRIFECEVGILAVSLNEAIDELNSGSPENAWMLLHLADSAWNSLAGRLRLLLAAMDNHLAVARIVVAPPRIISEYFRSDIMMDYVRLHDLINQFLFRTKRRFNLQVRMLRHGVEALTTDFRNAQPRECLAPGLSAVLWNRLDRDFHDFDLVTKEIMLTVRFFVSGLSETDVRSFAAELRPVLAPPPPTVRPASGQTVS